MSNSSSFLFLTLVAFILTFTATEDACLSLFGNPDQSLLHLFPRRVWGFGFNPPLFPTGGSLQDPFCRCATVALGRGGKSGRHPESLATRTRCVLLLGERCSCHCFSGLKGQFRIHFMQKDLSRVPFLSFLMHLSWESCSQSCQKPINRKI